MIFGLKVASKVFKLSAMQNLVIPMCSRILGKVIPQGTAKVQREEDMIKSEWQLAMRCIEAEICLNLKGC
jgi:hypothetical protein